MSSAAPPRSHPSADPRAAPPAAATVLALALGYFAAVFALGFVLGVVRTLALEPLLGRLLAVALELPLMLAWAWWVSRWLLQRQPGLSPSQAAAMGAVALLCLLAAEAGLSLVLGGRSLAGHLALYLQPAHALGLAGQGLFAGWPWLQARQRAAQR